MSGTNSPAPDRATVLALFERHRKTPGAPLDESHFLDYLLAQPKRNRAVYNSFSGLRRYNAFVDEVHLKFSICLSIQDRDANYSLEAFVKRLAELQYSRRSSLASLRNQQRRGFGWGTVALVNLLALTLCALALRHAPLLALAMAAVVVVGNLSVIRFFVHQTAYNRQLMSQLQSSAPGDS